MARAPIGDTLRQIGRLFAGGAVAGQSDAALLRRFVAERDEEAFAGLVARHGPMVLAVCRGALRDPGDLEDAFQATFLVLVRRAGSIWVDESLGGWLYRVARRVALRANADAIKRRARERQGVDMDAIAGREAASADRPEAALHDEIARLPEGLRRAIVLCELEGLTQVEAARILHCGEATLRRRLAGARERLRVRLTRQGVATSSIMALLRPAVVPTGWGEATVRAAMASGQAATIAARLAASVAAATVRARRLRVAALGVVAVTSAWGVVAAQQGKGDVAKPAVIPKAERPAPKWAHLTSDTGYEAWVRLEDGRHLWKAGESAGVRDPASGTELNYRGQGPIERRPDVVGVNEDGSRNVGFALERAGAGPLDEKEMRPSKPSEEERRFGAGTSCSSRAISPTSTAAAISGGTATSPTRWARPGWTSRRGTTRRRGGPSAAARSSSSPTRYDISTSTGHRPSPTSTMARPTCTPWACPRGRRSSTHPRSTRSSSRPTSGAPSTARRGRSSGCRGRAGLSRTTITACN